MGEVINGVHEPCTKQHWCENHCLRRTESEGATPSCDCDQFGDDSDDSPDKDDLYDYEEDEGNSRCY